MKHKQFILSLALLFLLGACQPQMQEKEITVKEISTEQLINEIDVHDLEILEIDNCEYIFYKKSPSTNRGYGFMAHKGNCKNPIHSCIETKKDHF